MTEARSRGARIVRWFVLAAAWGFGRWMRQRRRETRRLEREREEKARVAVADERARIARELHDVLAHSMSVIDMHAGAARLAMGTELTGIVPGPDGVVATLRPSGGGAPRTVHARYVVVADSLPKNPSGKILKRELRTTHAGLAAQKESSR